jgi:hypothetical protein
MMRRVVPVCIGVVAGIVAKSQRELVFYAVGCVAAWLAWVLP